MGRIWLSVSMFFLLRFSSLSPLLKYFIVPKLIMGGGSLVRNRPDNLVIVSRKFEYDPLSALEKNRVWHKDGIVPTHFINAFQAMFPEGERVFIDTVRECFTKYPSVVQQDSELKSDLDRFIEQEGRHSVAHDKWTKALVAIGYENMTTYSAMINRFRTWVRSNLSMKTRLSITIGAEHVTASLASLFAYDKPEMVLNSSPPVSGDFSVSCHGGA
jgi:predicted metal-dependent hydrolase